MLTSEQIGQRWPRLLAACRWAAILSAGEATSMLQVWPCYRGKDGERFAGGEAVCHFGGPRRVLHAAIRSRHVVAKMRREATCNEVRA